MVYSVKKKTILEAMKNIKYLNLCIFALFSCLQIGKTQVVSDSLDRWYLLDRQGNKYFGELLGEDRKTIQFLSESVGEFELSKKKIRYLERVHPELLIDSIYYPKYRFPHHNGFSPTGAIGPSYYQNTMVYLHTFNINIKNKMSLGLGAIPVFNFEEEGYYLWISPKVPIKLQSDKLKLSIGYFGAIRPNSSGGESSSSDALVGILYGALSHGNDFYKVSVGLGYGMFAGDFLKWPFYSISGMIRHKRRSFFRIELLGGAAFGSYSSIAIRKQFREVTWDLGWILPANRERSPNFFGGPMLSILYLFGKR